MQCLSSKFVVFHKRLRKTENIFEQLVREKKKNLRLEVDKFLFFQYNNSMSPFYDSGKGIEAWLSLVERRVRDAEAASSSLVASTTKKKHP